MAVIDRSAFALAALLVSVLAAGAGCSSEEGPAPPDEQAPAAASAAAGTTTASAAADPPTATDQGRSVEERIEDASLATHVKTALVEDRRLRPFDFDPRVTGERVTLVGNVATREQGRVAAEVAGEVDGVGDVLNRLTVGGKRVAWNSSSGGGGGAGASSSGGQKQVAASQQQQDASAGSSEPSGSGTYHTVQAGESLWAIASEYGTSVQRIKKMNNLRSNSLQAGERLLVEKGGTSSSSSSASSGSAAADAGNTGGQQNEQSETSSASEESNPEEEDAGQKSKAYYVVKSGESLWSIAQKNDVTVDRLKKLNGLTSNDLMPGDRLRVE